MFILNCLTRGANVTRYATVIFAAVGAGCSRPPAGDASRGPAAANGTRAAGPGHEMPGRGGMMGGMGGTMMGAATADTSAAPVVHASTAAAGAGCPLLSQDLADTGRAVFSRAGNCFACHGAAASGTASAPDLTDGSWLNIDGSYPAIARLVRTGVPHPKQYPAPMPAKGGAVLSDSQVCAVAGYVYSVSHR